MDKQLTDEKLEAREELARRFADTGFLTKAIGEATRQAILEHKRRGNPVAIWQDGKVVIVQPEDIEVSEDNL